MLLKFAGLGRYGSATHARAERLAEAGFTPPVVGLRDGFLLQTFVPGRPLCRADADASLLRRAAGYLAHLRRRFVCDRRIAVEPLLEMIEVNVIEGLGTGWRHRLGDLDRFHRVLAGAPAVAVDGRMMPHEWLRTPCGIAQDGRRRSSRRPLLPGPAGHRLGRRRLRRRVRPAGKSHAGFRRRGGNPVRRPKLDGAAAVLPRRLSRPPPRLREPGRANPRTTAGRARAWRCSSVVTGGNCGRP